MAGRVTASVALCVLMSTWGRFGFAALLAKIELMLALQLRASDDDDSIWFFSAPPSFLGDKSEAFGG
jgi:hypothetical protein